MNISTTPRRVAQGLLVLCFTLASMVGAKAQCGDFSAIPSGPVTINLTLNGGGTVNLTNAILNGSGFFIPGGGFCDMWLSDDPDPTILASYSNTPITFTCADIGTSTWHIRAGGNGGVGISGNGGPGATIIDITINVIDNIPPTVTCPANVVTTTDPGFCSASVPLIGATSADNCSATHTWSQISGPTIGLGTSTPGNASGALFAVGTSVVRYTAIDPSLNTATCEFSVTVTDDEPAVITCPLDQVVGTNPSTLCSYAYVGGDATATDNCAPPPTIINNYTSTSTLAGAIFPAGPNGATLVTPVIWTATAPGIPGSVNCVQNITVTDNDVPVFVYCPPNITVNASAPAACDYLGLAAQNPTATDNCSAPTFLNSYDATNTLVGKSFPLVGSPYTITWTATDAQSNSTNNCTFSITVIDVNPPVVVGPVPVTTTLNVTAGDCAKVVTFTRPAFGAVTDCGPVTMSEAFFSGPDPTVLTGAPAFSPGSTITVQFPAGVTVIRYTWSDNVVPANITTIDYTFNIIENDPPDANCILSTLTVVLDPFINVALVDPALINNGSTDNCGIMDMTVSPATFDCNQLGYLVGNQMVTLTVTDNASNTATCTANVYVVDNTIPAIGCPASFVVPNNPITGCDATVPGLIFSEAPTPSPGPLEFSDNSFDNCGLTFDYSIDGGLFTAPVLITVSNTFSDLSGEVFTAGNHTVTLRVADGSGNIGICNFSVNVQDQTPPAIVCPGTVTVFPLIGSCLSTATWMTPVPTDNCPGAISLSSTFPSGFSFPGGTTVVTYTAVDLAGNIGTCTFNVLVSDVQNPVAKCQHITVNLSNTTPGLGAVTVTPAMIDDGSTDNCGYFYTSANGNYTCANIGTNDYTLQIQDAAGNTSTKTCVVTVKDVNAPTLTCPGNITVTTPLLPTPATCVVGLTGSVSATDNCTVSAYQYALGVMPPSGAFVTFGSGNLANIPAFPLGTTTVNIRALDGVLPTPNISNVCVFTVTVQDVTPPVFLTTPPAAITVNCDMPYTPPNPTATDNCGTASVALTLTTNGGTICTPTITRLWVASDNAVPANTLSFTQVVTIVDVAGPVFNANFIQSGIIPINVTGPLSCTGTHTLTVLNNVNITDACNGVPSIAYTIVPAPDPLNGLPSGFLTYNVMTSTFTLPVSVFPIGTNVVTLTASDGCLNTTSKVINIVVTDNQAPVFKNNYALAPAGNCGKVFTLPNTTNNCDQSFTWIRPIASDISDCGAFTVTESINNPTVQAFVNLLNPFGFPPAVPAVIAQFPVGETTVTYTATQGTNVSVCSFVVKILDTQAPTITCPANQNLSVSSSCAAAAQIPVYSPTSISDNCPNNVTITQSPLAGVLVSSVVPVVPGNTFTVTLKATDNFPNNLMSVPCSFVVTLVDGQAPVPVITNLPDITSNCTKDTVTAPSATDCNGTVLVTIYGTPSVPVMMILPPLVPGGPPRYVLNPGNYVITWSYSDPQNNTTTQPQNVFITVDDDEPTAVGQPLNVNLDASGNAIVTAVQLNNGSFDPDNCGPIDLSIRTGISPNFVYVDTLGLNCSNLANMGANTVVFAVTDINGNIATVNVVVTVHDVTSPTFTNAWTATQMDTVIQACQLVPTAAAFPQIAIDQCDPAVNITLLETSTQTGLGCTKYSYVINRTWTATDDSGNTTSRTQKIIVTDTQAPVYAANTPLAVTANTAPNAQVCNAAVNFNMAAFVSDCQLAADVTIINALISAPIGNTFVIPSGSNISAPNYPVGTYVVRFTSTDNCGNSSTKDVTIQVNDATPPTAVCINGVSASLQPSGTVNVTVNQFNNFSYDNCTNVLGLLIQRLDQIPLVAPTPTLEYNCADADGVTQHGVKLFVADAVGNMSMCLTYIVIQDNVAPTITCPPNKTVQCSDILTPAVQGVATAVDNCPIVADSISFTDAIGGGVGNICQVLTRTWKVVDLADNISTCDQLLSIQDTIKPSFVSVPSNITVSCSDGSIAVTTVDATDNCDPSVIPVLTVDTISIAQGDCGLFDYTIVRTWTATDDCGNSNVHTRLIKVVDITDPAFAGMPDTLILNTSQFPPNLTCSVPWNFNVGQFLEDCSPDSIMLVTNDSPFGDGQLDLSGNYPIGTYMIHFAAIDACGNVGIDSIYVEVVDNSVPTLVCNNNVVIALGTNGEATIDANDIDLGSTDNCAIDTLVLSTASFDCSDLGVNTISLTATDIFGNTNSCVVQVSVTLGINTGFNLTATGTPESYFGADNGTATAVATGGTGVFSYLWNTNDTTAVVNNLAAGTYTVSVIDVNSGCISVDTVIVQAGAKITITVGADNACQGQTISIPVTVDNFLNVSGFSLGLALSNGAVGAITALTNVNPALIGLIPGVNSVFWTHPTLDPTTLPNGSVLFNVEIQLSAAAVGTTSSIIASALPALVFLQDGVNQAPMVNFNNGSATISCPATPNLQIAGDVFTWKAPVKPIPGVTVDLAGTVIGTDLTALPNADYGFAVAGGSNTTVSALKIATVKNQQINVGDLLGIQAHSAFPQQLAFNNGYQWVAGDVNGDQKVNLADYGFVQKYVLGNGAHFTNNQGQQVGPDWKFIASSHVFMPLPPGNPQAPLPNPLNTPVPPSFITHLNLAGNFLADDFTGVLMGDVNGTVNPTLTNGGGGAESAEELKFRLDERAIQAGETVTIPFKALDFNNAQAYQMTIAFDPEVLELQDIQAGVLPGLTESNFGTDYLVDGLLSTLWVGGKSISLNDNETLFSLTFKALESVSTLSSVLHSSSDITEAMAIDEAGNAISVDFEYVASVAAGEVESKTFALYQNQPNPFNSETTISFRLPESGRATLRVFSVEGRLVKTVIGDFAEGLNAIRFQKSDFGSTGVFYYELETPKHSDRKKMILID